MAFCDDNTYLLYCKDTLIGEIVEPSIGIAYKIGKFKPNSNFQSVKDFIEKYYYYWDIFEDTDDWQTWEVNYEKMKNQFGEDILLDENWKLFSIENNKQYKMSIPLIDTSDNSITWKI